MILACERVDRQTDKTIDKECDEILSSIDPQILVYYGGLGG